MKHTLNRSSVKNDYQKQIILRLAMIVLYFVMLFCIIVINNIYINTKNDMDAVKNLKLTQMKQNFDFRMDMALTSVENLKRTQEVVGYAQDGSDYLSIAKIYTRLTENQNAYTQQSFLLALQKPYGDLVITPSGTMPAKDFCAQYDIASGSAEQNLSAGYAFLTPVSAADAGSLVVQLNETVGHTATPIIFFVIMDKADILPGPLSSAEQLVVAADGRPVLTSPDLQGSAAVLNEVYASVVEEKKSGSDIADISLSDINAKLSFSNTKKFRDLSFLLLSERGTAQKIGEFFSYLFAPLMTLLFLFGLFLALRTAKGIYEPIVKLKGYYKEVFSDEEDTGEFAFIEESTKKLTASYKEVLEERRLSSEYAKDSFLHALLRGLLSEKEIAQRAAFLSLGHMEEACIACIVDIVEFLSDGEEAPECDIETLDQIGKDLKESMRLHLACDMTAVDKGRFVLILYTGDPVRAKALLAAAAAGLARRHSVRVRAVLGDAAADIVHISASYQSAKKTAAVVSPYSNQVVFSADDLPRRLVEDAYYYPIEKEKLLMTYVLNGKKESALALIDEILRFNYEDKTISAAGSNNFLLAVAGTVNRILQESGIPIEELFEEGTLIYPELKMLKTAPQLRQRVIEIFTQIADAVTKAGEETNTKLSERLLGYVNDNYHKDISLVDIAAAFNLSAGYISVLFKKATGKNFKDYLTVRRMTAAKQLMLHNPDAKVKDIAQKVGYNNVNTFIRIFKKQEGMSPGEFLAQRGKEGL